MEISSLQIDRRTRAQTRKLTMGGRRRKEILVGLFVAMIFGIAVYFRLWAIDYSVSSDDTEILRRQFDLANREAMDESAAWRMRYDEEAVKAAKCMNKLKQIKEPSHKDEVAATSNQKLAMLQKENMELLERVEALKQELEAEKLKCRKQ